ncbi:hypothetical protein [Clostridium minihomine]|uniref:hypothetical protein n=1 Tax=Clostridium minihomine TaxID=2045012 RepID=UPI00101AE2B8|nr:hypothetical protein [Clostridium minihomine]
MRTPKKAAKEKSGENYGELEGFTAEREKKQCRPIPIIRSKMKVGRLAGLFYIAGESNPEKAAKEKSGKNYGELEGFTAEREKKQCRSIPIIRSKMKVGRLAGLFYIAGESNPEKAAKEKSGENYGELEGFTAERERKQRRPIPIIRSSRLSLHTSHILHGTKYVLFCTHVSNTSISKMKQ